MFKKIIKNLRPRVIYFSEKFEKSSVKESDDIVDKAVSWWKEDKYTKLKRHKKFQWLGITWFKWSYHETIEGIYFKVADDLVKIVKEMQHSKIIPLLDKNSTILESGCNIGRNIYALQKEFGSNIIGVDISKEALNIAKNKIWNKRTNYKFYLENVLTTDFFDKMEDNEIDLVLTRWHLIHLPLSDAKRKYVESLKRIGKVFLILEPVKEGTHETQLFADGTYCLSWDDWIKEYNLFEYKTTLSTQLLDGTRIFYSKEV